MVFPMPMLGSRLVMLVTVLDGKDNERKVIPTDYHLFPLALRLSVALSLISSSPYNIHRKPDHTGEDSMGRRVHH